MNVYMVISQLMCACHYGYHDFMNQNNQLYFKRECVGWHVVNAKVGLELLIIKVSWAGRANLSYTWHCSQTARFARGVWQSLRPRTINSLSQQYHCQCKVVVWSLLAEISACIVIFIWKHGLRYNHKLKEKFLYEFMSITQYVEKGRRVHLSAPWNFTAMCTDTIFKT